MSEKTEQMGLDTTDDPAASLPDRSGILAALAKYCGLAGGMIFVALTLTTVVSICARWFLGAPIPGDFELIEIGTSLGVFMALPYAQLVGAHVIVDIATEGMPARGKALLDALASLMFGAFMGVLTWRLYHGLQDMLLGRDSTMILQIPLWSTFPIIIASTFLTVLVCGYTTGQHLKRAFG
ncbi:TRAP transporter small permease [Mameliella alba]|nr:TRAP transporter small permease [Mameliella alba]